MPSGYEQSPDYGGPKPKSWLWAVEVVVLVVVTVGYWIVGYAAPLGRKRGPHPEPVRHEVAWALRR